LFPVLLSLPVMVFSAIAVLSLHFVLPHQIQAMFFISHPECLPFRPCTAPVLPTTTSPIFAP
jgi:hypothetical protein